MNLEAKDGFPSLVGTLGELIRQARAQVLRTVDTLQVQTCWHIGRHIVEFEQGGASRATYGKRLLPQLAEALTAEFGKGFDVSNLRHMRAFFLAFPIWDAVRRELAWTHYRLLLRVDTSTAREWYMNEAASQNWSSRALERQIGTLYYERLLSSQDKAPVIAEASAKTASLTPRDIVRDPVVLEFLGFPNAGAVLENDLESVVRYSVLHENEQLFASKYKLILPSEEELRRELDRERGVLEARDGWR